MNMEIRLSLTDDVHFEKMTKLSTLDVRVHIRSINPY